MIFNIQRPPPWPVQAGIFLRLPTPTRYCKQNVFLVIPQEYLSLSHSTFTFTLVKAGVHMRTKQRWKAAAIPLPHLKKSWTHSHSGQHIRDPHTTPPIASDLHSQSGIHEVHPWIYVCLHDFWSISGLCNTLSKVNPWLGPSLLALGADCSFLLF